MLTTFYIVMFLGLCFVLAVEKKKDLFLMAGAEFFRKFYFNVCKLLRADAFVDMYHVFVPNVHYSGNTLKIVNLHYINYSGCAIKKQ